MSATPELSEAALQLIAICSSHGRVCPLPIQWNDLWELLPDRRRVGLGWEPPLPLVLGAWAHTSALDKMLRLRDHIAWADAHGALTEADAFLRALDESQWLHNGEWPG